MSDCWSDISSAPKDGTRILVYIPGAREAKMTVVRWEKIKGRPEWDGWYSYRYGLKGLRVGADVPPTHWRYLPDPPAGNPAPKISWWNRIKRKFAKNR